MFPRRNFKILLIFLIVCSFLLIYSLSLITTKEIVVFSTNNNIIAGTAGGGGDSSDRSRSRSRSHSQIHVPSALLSPLSPHAHHRFGSPSQSILSKAQSQSQERTHAHAHVHAHVHHKSQFRPIPNKDASADVSLDFGAAPPNSNAVAASYHQSSAAIKPAVPDTLFREDLSQQPPQRLDSPAGVAQQNENQAVVNPFHHPPSSPGPTLLKIPYKLVHFDLKGAPPKISYLKSVLETVKEAGGNGILLEYEDMFPFAGGGLNGTAHLFHYSQEEINDLIATCNQLGLEIIPLVQTFGHLEFILKLERFRHLREVDDFPQEICPKNEVAWSLVTTLIDQIVAMHKDSQYIHIGCDEVFHIGECSRCQGKDAKELFLNHVRRVATYVRDKHKKRSIVWDDMFRKYYTEELLPTDIGSLVELMIWDYTEDVDRLVSPFLWPMYGQVFPNIWIASAYKGAFGESLYTVEMQRHALNQMSWIQVVSRETPKIKNLRGFAVTGWSRYDHFAVLCELLPVAIPSILLTLQVLVLQNTDDATKALYKFLKCDPNASGFSQLDDCTWNGADLYNLMRSLRFYEEEARRLITQHRSEKGWLNPYNLKYNYSSPWRVSEPMQIASQQIISIRTYETTLRITLKNYYEQHVIDEWIEQKIEPIISSLELLIRDCKALSARKSWDRRPPPLPSSTQLNSEVAAAGDGNVNQVPQT